MLKSILILKAIVSTWKQKTFTSHPFYKVYLKSVFQTWPFSAKQQNSAAFSVTPEPHFSVLNKVHFKVLTKT